MPHLAHDRLAAESFNLRIQNAGHCNGVDDGCAGETFKMIFCKKKKQVIRTDDCAFLIHYAHAITITRPYAVDVASGVEHEPGRKDHAAMEAFFEAANSLGAKAA